MPIMRLLWISPATEALERPVLSKALPGCSCDVISEPHEALAHLKAKGADVVLASCLLADWTPAELLEEIQRMNSGFRS